MKNRLKCKFIALVVLFSGLLTFPLSYHVEAQDSAKITEKKGIVVLKIKKDDNGKTTVIDTTFTITTSGSHHELEEYLKKHEVNLNSQNDELDYNYDFDIPCPPDVPPPPPYPGYEGFEREFIPGADIKMLRYGNKRQTLGDIIGDIPMDRVKSYSIKDKKNGKRIVIDIEDAPLLEKQDKIIIMREPGRYHRNANKSGPQMKVIINSEEDRQIEKPTEPPPPPPPPPKEKEGK